MTRTRLLGTGLIAVMLLIAALAVYWPIFQIRPFGGDNLYVLAWVSQAPLSALIPLDPEIYPEWRPLAWQSIWLEHRLVPLEWTVFHHVVNLLLWVACLALVYRITRELARSAPAGLVAAAILIVDPRPIEALTLVVERQTTLACALGLAALLIVVRHGERALSRRRAIAVGVLLLGAAMSKEYGLAFASALLLYATAMKRADLAAAAVAPLLLYLIVRVAAVGALSSAYCEEMGYFNDVNELCFSPFRAEDAPQMLYNVFASGVAILLPGIFTDPGVLQIQPVRLLMGGVMLLSATVAIARADRRTRLIALVAVANGALSFMIYRERNQLIGACAVAIVAGAGAAWLQRSALLRSAAARRLAAAALVLLACWQLSFTRVHVSSSVADLLEEPCESDLREYDYGQAFIERLKRTYAMPDPNCSTYD